METSIVSIVATSSIPNMKTQNILMESIGYSAKDVNISHSMTLSRVNVGAIFPTMNGKGISPEHIPVVLNVSMFNPERKQNV